MENKEKQQNKRELVATACYCRQFLYFSNLITEAENDKIHARIIKLVNRNKVEITEKQLDSVEVKYKGK